MCVVQTSLDVEDSGVRGFHVCQSPRGEGMNFQAQGSHPLRYIVHGVIALDRKLGYFVELAVNLVSGSRSVDLDAL